MSDKTLLVSVEDLIYTAFGSLEVSCHAFFQLGFAATTDHHRLRATHRYTWGVAKGGRVGDARHPPRGSGSLNYKIISVRNNAVEMRSLRSMCAVTLTID